jgi:hypothetical protein
MGVVLILEFRFTIFAYGAEKLATIVASPSSCRREKENRKGVGMNFNFGEVLTRAAQITWKHKNLWLAGIIVSLISLLSGSISLISNPSFSSFSDPAEVNKALPSILLSNGLVLLLTILSIPVYVVGMAIPSLGTLQVERGMEKVNFGELIRGVLPYFWRILGIVALIWVGVFAVMMLFFGCILVLSLITFGIGALCAVPLIILFIPLAVLVYALMEQGVSAVIVDDLGFSSALQRAWELVKKNLGVMALLSIIIYLGATIISTIISVPMMIPMFGFFFNMGSEPDFEAIDKLFRNMTLWMLAFSPLYALLQGILLTYMQSVWTLTYMRLTRAANTSQPLPASLEATT